MALLYRGPDALITDEVFESLGPQPQSYLINELQYLHVVRGRPLEIRAVYRGQLICLFHTRDRQVFGQVQRALLRALERLEDAS
jgi:hypothetical protein